MPNHKLPVSTFGQSGFLIYIYMTKQDNVVICPLAHCKDEDDLNEKKVKLMNKFPKYDIFWAEMGELQFFSKKTEVQPDIIVPTPDPTKPIQVETARVMNEFISQSSHEDQAKLKEFYTDVARSEERLKQGLPVEKKEHLVSLIQHKKMSIEENKRILEEDERDLQLLQKQLESQK